MSVANETVLPSNSIRERLNREVDAVVAAIRPLLLSPRFLITLGIVWIVDAGLGGLDLAYRYAVLDGTKLPAAFDLTQEGGLSESWEYLLTTLAALAMARLFLKVRAPIYGLGVLIFTWMTLDNAIEIHERGGHLIAPLFALLPPSRLQPQDLGEFALLCMIALVIVLGIWRSLRSGDRHANALGLAVMACIALAGVFGVGVDLVHAAMHTISRFDDEVGTFIEEFGELTCLSLSVALTLSIAATPRGERDADTA